MLVLNNLHILLSTFRRMFVHNSTLGVVYLEFMYSTFYALIIAEYLRMVNVYESIIVPHNF